MKKTAERIENCIQQDPGNRGLDKWAYKGDLLPAAQSLFQGNHVIIATGFYILDAQVVETDGPPGTVVLARALRQLGKRVCLLVDDHSKSILEEGLAVLDADVELATVPVGRPVDSTVVMRDDTTHFIALERPGKARDGRYYNFRGKDISAYVAPLDELFLHARNRGITTIGIGDGGNEMGMGRVSPQVDRYITPDRAFSCTTEADFCICAGVSNWAGYGMAAMLSKIKGENLMPPPAKLEKLIEAVVQAGAVDGVTGKCQATVDGLEPAWERSIYGEMVKLSEGG